jgi:hypothetical protein
MRQSTYLPIAGTAAALLTLITAACAPSHYVQIQDDSIALYLENDSAKEVLFASSIDQYQLHPATRSKNNLWTVTVPWTKEFSYFYLVDKTLTLPACQFTVRDDFGSKNCLFAAEM